MFTEIIERLYGRFRSEEISPEEKIKLNLEELRKALNKKNSRKITREAFRVTNSLELELEYPGVWDYDRIVTARDYLRKASEATLNTKYFMSCHSRIEFFESKLEAMKYYQEGCIPPTGLFSENSRQI